MNDQESSARSGAERAAGAVCDRSPSGRRSVGHWLRCLALALSLVLPLAAANATGSWTPLARTPPGPVGLMILLSDGTVLAFNSGVSNAVYRLTPDSQGHYTNGTWTTIAAMNNTRLYYSSQVLKDGRLFVAGGEYGTGTAAGEVYNPLTNTWTLTPAPGQTFSDSNSVLLPDGRVMVAVVSGSLRSTMLYNPVTNTWATGPTCLGIHNESEWVKLPDDSVLLVDRNTTNAERYIPAQNQWLADATVPVSLYDPFGLETGAGFLLPNGKAILFGSLGHNAIYTPSGSTANGSWVAAPDFPGATGAPDAPAAMMPNGKILCAVSPIPTSGNHFPSPTTFYEYDYVANAFTSVATPTGATLNHAAYYGTMLVLPDGAVLYADFNSQIYSYQHDGAPLASGKPVVSSVSANGDGSFHLVGTQLNGISTGSSYGDDNQNGTNYPIVKLTSGSNVYYCRSYNWSSTGVMTGATPLSTEFTVPVSVPVGTYSLAVVANGISSDPVVFTIAAVAVLEVTPTGGLSASGTYGGPFSPPSATYTLTNTGNAPLNWTAAKTAGWLTLSATSGTLAAGANTTVTASINAGANTLLPGGFNDTVTFANATSGQGNTTRGVALTVSGTPALSVTPAGGLSSSGNGGGPFGPAGATYTVINSGTAPMSWSAARTASWLTLSATSGALEPGAIATVSVTINANANSLVGGTYNDSVTFTNTTNGIGNTTRAVALTVTGSPVLAVTPANGVTAFGRYGGPFTAFNGSFNVANTGLAPLNWTAARSANWLSLSATSGTLAPGAATTVTVTINAGANSLEPGGYEDTIVFRNTSNGVGNTTRPVPLSVVLVAPAFLAEPPLTGGATNTISWTPVFGAGQYEVKCSNGATSGLIAGTSYTFTGLSSGSYTYQVRSQRIATEVTVSAWSPPRTAAQDATLPALASTPAAATTLLPTIALQGTAGDAGGVQSVTVGGSLAQTSDGFAHWSATVSGLAAGANPVTVTASDNASPPNVRTQIVTITRLADGDADGLPDTWQDARGLTGADRAPGADPDFNGLNNLLEYAFNLDPNASAAEGLPVNAVTINPADGKKHLHLSYRRWIGGGGLEYVVETSTDLANWSAAGANLTADGAPAANGDGVTETVNLWINPAIDAAPRKIVRLHIYGP